MRNSRRIAIAVVLPLVALAATSVLAQPIIDGNASPADGYTSLSIQNTNTEFGNATLPDLLASGGGSEIDQIFGKIENGRLYMVVAGNLETNFNKLQVFIDSVSGGVSTIDADIFSPEDNNVPNGLDPFCCGGLPSTGGNPDNIGGLNRMDGMTFDTGFEADYALVFSHGREEVGANSPINKINFYAANAHFADLTQGTSGAVVAAGIQLGPQGINRVMRISPADFVNDFDVDGDDFLRWQRNSGRVEVDQQSQPVEIPLQEGNSDRDNDVDGDDLATWQARYGTDRLITDQSFSPFNGGPQTSSLLFGDPLPGLSQGDLIDQNYALGPDGGCTADGTDGGAGCAVPELEFVLPVDSNDPTNTLNHRNFDNSVGLQLGVDNSNNVGVSGEAGDNNYTDPTTEDPSLVTTGFEFSIPLSEIGNPDALSDIKVTTLINGSGFDFSSNQYGGDGVLQNNLGGDGSGGFTGDFSGVDLSSITGDQFVTIQVPAAPPVSGVPEPTSLLLVGLGVGCGLLGRKRHA